MADFTSPPRSYKYTSPARPTALTSTPRAFNFKSPNLQDRK